MVLIRTHSTCATILRFLAGLTSALPGALCLTRFCCLIRSALIIVRRSLVACKQR